MFLAEGTLIFQYGPNRSSRPKEATSESKWKQPPLQQMG